MAGVRNSTELEDFNDAFSNDNIMKELPTRLVSSLMPFQKEGVAFCVKKEGRCLIADEMGLGKTLQAIAVSYYYRSEWPLLIVVPSSLRYAWIEELEKWLPDILPHEINLIQGGFDTGGIADAKVTIVTYGLLSCKSSANVKEALQARRFKVVICDESHYFKNSRTECCKAVMPLLTSAERCLLLSGTPAVARPSELFTQLDALRPGKFGSFWSFTKKYCAAHWQYFGQRRQWRADGASNLDELQQRLTSVMIRREKMLVLPQLPAKQRQKILFPLKDSSTKKEILSTFAELKPLLKKSRSSLATNLVGGESSSYDPKAYDAADIPDTNILSHIQRLYNLTGEAKIGPAREYIQMLCANADLKFLVFAYHHSMMDGLQQALWGNKVKCVRIDGHTKPSERQLYVQQFQSDKNIRVALLSILAAGVGLTLTAASLVVFAELYWTPGVMVQCEDRVHRIGQTSTVPIHYLVAKDTMDEWVWSAVCRKTLVTTTALSGKRQALQADAGGSDQVELLSSADAYTPPENVDNDIDVMALVQSQVPQDQKSILDFFSSRTTPSEVHASNPLSSRKQATCCKVKEHDLAEVKSDLVKSPSSHQARKQHFPLFTALKKTPPTTSKLSQDLIVVNSSEDELVCGGLEKSSSVKNPVTGSNSKKRKCSVASLDVSSDDSQFEEVSPGYSATKPKRKKFASKTTPKSSVRTTPKSARKNIQVQDSTTPGKAMIEGSLSADALCKTPRVSKNREMVFGTEWPCSMCTFSNTSLLPFCEMCNTPRKQKGRDASGASQYETSSLDKDSNAPTSPAVTSTQVSVCKMHTEPKESLTESEGDFDEVNKQLFFRQASHDPDDKSGHKVNRNLGLSDVDELHPNFEIVLSDVDEEQVTEEDKQSYRGLSLESECTSHSYQPKEAIASSAEKGFQQLSSFTVQDTHQNSHSYIKHGDAEAVDNRVLVSNTGSCQVQNSLSASQRSAHKTKPQAVTEVSEHCVSSTGIDNSLSSHFDHSTDGSHGLSDSESICTSDVKASCVVRHVKRRCFMLGDDEEQGCAETQDRDENVGERLTACDRRLSVDKMDCEQDKCDPTGDEISHSKDKSSYTGNTFRQSENMYAQLSSKGKKLGQAENKLIQAGDQSDCAEVMAASGNKENELSCPSKAEAGVVSEGRHGLHSFFQFCCSGYSGRVYLFDEQGNPLNANFLPLDVELDNIDQLPDILHHPQHLRLAKIFLRHWNSLTDTKQRLISKRGLMFRNPLAAYDQVRTDLTNNKQRYKTKDDQAKAAVRKATELNGQVRVLSKSGCCVQQVSDLVQPGGGAVGDSSESTQKSLQGYVQAMSEDGIPLCLHCQQACSSLVSMETSATQDGAWNTRFCSHVCADAHWMKTNTAYIRSSLYDLQFGVCQLCSFDAHTLFIQIRDCSDMKQRSEKISKTKFSKLSAKQRKQMVARPYEGLFWQVDHIHPVWEGGGQCDIDNLRTLCTPCHQEVTAKQAAKRAVKRRLTTASTMGNIAAFFKKT